MRQNRFVTLLFILSFLLNSPIIFADTLGDKLKAVFSSSNVQDSDEIMRPDDAYKLTAQVNSDNSISLDWSIEPGYYLYHDKFKVTVPDDSKRLGSYTIPAGKLKQDPAFGEVEVHYHQVVFNVPIINSSLSSQKIDLEVGYQGCKEDSICYPPQKKTFNLELIGTASANPVQSAVITSTIEAEKISEQDAITQRLLAGSFVVNLLTFFGFGLLLSLTPCVFPMVPILSGIIVGQGASISTTRAFILSLTFVLAMALTYALLGVIAGSFNFNLQAASQNLWVIVLFSGVFVLLALSMFGFYQLQLPDILQNKLNAVSENQQAGRLKGVAVMGVLSAIIVGPCVAPPLAGALLYISQTGDAVLGGASLLLMGLGFGVPLLIIGTSTGSLLPRAGQWMDAVKTVFGVIMLGVAIWFLERVLSSSVTSLLWAALFIISAVYMGVLDRLETTTKWHHFRKGLGLVMLCYGVIMIIGSATGGGTLTEPFKTFHVNRTIETKQTTVFTYIRNETELEQALITASQVGKPVMLDFYADWCVVCNELEKYTFPDARVSALFSEMVLLKADVTQNNDDDKALLKRFGLFGPPGVIFFDRDGQELKSYRVVGFIDADAFSQHLHEVIAL